MMQPTVCLNDLKQQIEKKWSDRVVCAELLKAFNKILNI